MSVDIRHLRECIREILTKESLLAESQVNFGTYTVNILPELQSARTSAVVLDLSDVVIDDGTEKIINPAQAQKLSNIMLIRVIIDSLEGGKAARLGDMTEALTTTLFSDAQNINQWGVAGNMTFADIESGGNYYNVKYFKNSLGGQKITYSKIATLLGELESREMESPRGRSFGIFAATPSKDSDSINFKTYGPEASTTWLRMASNKAEVPYEQAIILSKKDSKTKEEVATWRKVAQAKWGPIMLNDAEIATTAGSIKVPSADDINTELTKLSQFTKDSNPYSTFVKKMMKGEDPLEGDQLKTVSGAYKKVSGDLATNLGSFVTNASDGTTKDRVEMGKSVNALQKTLRSSFQDGVPDKVDPEKLKKVIAALKKAEEEVDIADNKSDNRVNFQTESLREYIRESLLTEGIDFHELDSPLRYNKSGNVKRLAYCDSSVSEPPASRDAYFKEYQEMQTFGKSGRRLKKARKGELIPGVSNVCIIGFLDFHEYGENGWYIDYMKTRGDASGQGVASKLMDEFFARYAKPGGMIHFGKMMRKEIGHLKDKMEKQHPDVTVIGAKNF